MDDENNLNYPQEQQTSEQSGGFQQSPSTQNISTDYKVKIFYPKHLLVIIGLVLLDRIVLLVPMIGSLLVLAIFIGGIVMSLNVKKEIEANPEKANEKNSKLKIVAAMTISPLVVQAIYYYGFNKSNPELAKEYNNLGWKIFGLLILFGIMINFFLVALIIGSSIR